MDQIKIGRFIAESRKEKNYTQEQLAEKLGVSNRSISRYEVNVFIDRYLSTFEEISCGEEIYYYIPKYDYTIFQYNINNDGIGFVNTIYIGYHDGKYYGEE